MFKQLVDFIMNTLAIKLIKIFSTITLFLLLSGCFPSSAGKHLKHYAIESPKPTQKAPDNIVYTLNGEAVNLHSYLGNKPVVLQLGSHSCPVYRYRRFDMKKLYREYKDKVNFLVLYTLEAHPNDATNPYVDRKWVSSFNYVTNTLIPKHKSIQQRLDQANNSHTTLDLPYTMVVDNMNNTNWKSYGRAPSTAYVIDKQGNIALRQVWVNPNAMRPVLDELLAN